MSENPKFYLLVRITPEGDYQLSLGNDRAQVRERMVNDNWRAFELTNEKSADDLSA